MNTLPENSWISRRAVRIARRNVVSTPLWNRIIRSLMILVAFTVNGCDDHSKNDGPIQDAYSQRTAPSTDGAGGFNETSWCVVCIDGERAGSRETSYKIIDRQAERLIETRSNESIRIARDGQVADVDFACIALSGVDGGLIEVNYRLPIQDTIQWVRARVEGDKLVISSPSENGPVRRLQWSNDIGGPFAIAEKLRAASLSPGESCDLRYFEPSVSEVISVILRAVDWELTDVLGENRRLLKFQVINRMPNGAELESTLWVDQHGEVLKEMQSVGLEIVTYRTPYAPNMSPSETPGVDLFQRTLVGIEGMPPMRSRPERIAYHVTAPEGAASSLFVNDSRQRIQIVDRNRIKLVVTSGGNRLDTDAPTTESPPTDADIEASDLIQFKDPKVEALALTVPNTQSTAEATSIELERLVYELVEKKNYGEVFGSAVDVLQSRQGDCTEHSVLLMALCRARGIPARAAMGLFYSERHEAFAYHMWTEVWTGDAWLGLDATLGQGGIGPTHLKMSQSSLEGPAGLSEMTKILQSVNGMQIQLVERHE